jgi:hypothetical protein
MGVKLCSKNWVEDIGPTAQSQQNELLLLEIPHGLEYKWKKSRSWISMGRGEIPPFISLLTDAFPDKSDS